jgi:two-component system chemotaxis sensor kinase CheA
MTAIDPEVLQLAREEAEERIASIEKALLAVEGGSADDDAVNGLFRDAHSIKSAAGMLGWKDAAAVAHLMEDIFDDCRSGEIAIGDQIDELLQSLDSLKGAVPGGAGEAAPAPQTNGHAPPEPAVASASSSQSIRVPAPKIDRMLDAVGETVLHQRRLEHLLADEEAGDAADETEEELDRGGLLMSELHDSVIGMRTLPLSSITAPFPRAVRDLAAAEGKDVALEITGEETQLDRVILEGLSEMINHLIRNAIAHGIETPEEREAAGKPEQGRIDLHAEQREGMVAIELLDDGRGVSADVLSRVHEGSSLTEMLATPGFSTAAEVSGVAGRGVGVDAVKDHVEALGGSLEIQSEPGKGMRVIMLLPLTLALLRLLMCRRGSQIFGLPLTSVREVVKAADRVSLGGRQSLQLHGEAVPLEDLATALGGAAAELPDDAPAMVVASGGRSVAIQCDAVIGDQEVVVKSLGPLFAGVPGYLGASIQGDGRVALIVDPNHLVRRPNPVRQTMPVAAGESAPEARRVLVVDDQFTVRELQRSILETAGYRVCTARNGREALKELTRNDVEAVLTDAEMPEMNGFELLTAIRADPDHESLPVVMVTALASEEDRKRGAEAGADAYIVKEEYDQHALLDVIERLVGR